ncbi:MAG: AIR synthase, partial [Clostridiales bacterium]|nr:AIR synthase [Clostridiales bacterium]
METGKVPNSILKELVLDKLKKTRSEVLVRPQIGVDCCALDFGEYACVMSSDPITGSSKDAGKLAVHVSCNDIASFGVEPIGLLVTILAPPGTTVEELAVITDQLNETAASLNVDIIGGHTEVTDSVTRFVLVSTAIGKVVKSRMIRTNGAQAGDSIILTKFAGLEGTAIIASEKELELSSRLSAETINEAKGFFDMLSVVREGIIAAEFGASAMHDVTEGGLLGALWEVCEASGKGASVYMDKVPVADSTLKISDIYGIDPLRLISSGCMLICAANG